MPIPMLPVGELPPATRVNDHPALRWERVFLLIGAAFLILWALLKATL